MPSSCAELNDIGHTLNAFYIVRDNEVNSSKLQTIYCDFQSLPSDEGYDPAKSANTSIKMQELLIMLYLLIITFVWFLKCSDGEETWLPRHEIF